MIGQFGADSINAGEWDPSQIVRESGHFWGSKAVIRGLTVGSGGRGQVVGEDGVEIVWPLGRQASLSLVVGGRGVVVAAVDG